MQRFAIAEVRVLVADTVMEVKLGMANEIKEPELESVYDAMVEVPLKKVKCTDAEFVESFEMVPVPYTTGPPAALKIANVVPERMG